MPKFALFQSKIERFREQVAIADKANASRDWKSAERHYTSALKSNPRAWWIWVQLGHCLKEQKRFEKSERAYETAVKHKPNEADPFLHLGHLYKLRGHTDRAIVSYRKAFELAGGTSIAVEARCELASLGVANIGTSLFSVSLLNQKSVAKAGWVSPRVKSEIVSRIEESNLFDATWYRHLYSEELAGQVPVEHYVAEGEKLGLQPNALFDVGYYKTLNGNLGSDENALDRFIRCWDKDGVDPHPLFKLADYFGEAGSTRAEAVNPLAHFLIDGGLNGCSPCPFFDSSWYLSRYKDVRGAGVIPLVHYLNSGATELRDPHPLFSTEWYYRKNPRVAEAKINPLVHFELIGKNVGASVHPLFDQSWYLLKHGLEIKQGHPIFHYLEEGWRKGYDPHPLFCTSWYLQQNQDVAESGMNPLLHFLTSGWLEGRNPSPFFDVEWYREHFLSSHDVNPLVHFLALPDDTTVRGHPIIDIAHYKKNVPFSGKPLVDYVLEGFREGFSPSSSYTERPTARPASHTQGEFLAKSALFHQALIEDEPEEAECAVAECYFDWLRRPGNLTGEKVCLFAAYLADGTIPDSTRYYLRAMHDVGFRVIFVVACDGATSIDLTGLDFLEGVLIRDNMGFDFASWALAMIALPSVWKSKCILCTNDSVFGPVELSLLSESIEAMLASGADYCGLTDSYQVAPHIQSYFFILQNKALSSPTVQNYWSNLKAHKDKNKIISEYEVGFWSKYVAAGLSTYVHFASPPSDAELDVNPTLNSWKELLERGYPFLKVQLLRDSKSGMDSTGWEAFLENNAELRGVIAKRLGSLTERSRRQQL